MCHTERQWHRCGRHHKRVVIFCGQATWVGNKRYMCTDNRQDTRDGEPTNELCPNKDGRCALATFEGVWDCCRCNTKRNLISHCECGHEVCWSCVPSPDQAVAGQTQTGGQGGGQAQTGGQVGGWVWDAAKERYRHWDGGKWVWAT